MQTGTVTHLNIRLATPSDIPIIAKFTRAIALETEGLDLDLETVLKGVENGMKDSRHGFYVVAESDRCIASCLMITYEWSDWRNGVQWWLQSVYVDRNFRRLGIFDKMFRFVLAKANSQRNVCGVRLYVDKANTIAQSTYQSLGMHQSDYRVYELELNKKS